MPRFLVVGEEDNTLFTECKNIMELIAEWREYNDGQVDNIEHVYQLTEIPLTDIRGYLSQDDAPEHLNDKPLPERWKRVPPELKG